MFWQEMSRKNFYVVSEAPNGCVVRETWYGLIAGMHDITMPLYKNMINAK